MILLQGAMGAGIVIMEILKVILILVAIVIAVIYFLSKLKDPKANLTLSGKSDGENQIKDDSPEEIEKDYRDDKGCMNGCLVIFIIFFVIIFLVLFSFRNVKLD